MTDVLQNYFYAFNRDPFTAKNLFQHFVTTILRAGFDIGTVQRAVKELAEADGPLPQINKLLAVCRRHSPQAQIGTVKCMKCGGDGLVRGLFYTAPDFTRLEIGGAGHVPREDCTYQDSIIGRCKCANAYAWEHGRPVVEPPQFIQDEAKKNKWDCSFQAYVFARDYARAAHPHRQKGPLAKSLQTIIDNCAAKADEDDEPINFGEQEKIPF
jgi:hypothetical protein